MRRQTSIEQVAGILARIGIDFATAEEGDGYRILRGSTAVFISFEEWRKTSTVIHLFAPVVVDIPEDLEMRSRAAATANSLNEQHYFAKWVVTRGDLLLEYDLLGDELDERELVNALDLVARLADDFDDKLVDQLGGRLFDDKLAELEAEQPADEPE